MGMAQASTTWTAERLRALPEDGKRYELVDGELLVTPSPGWVHQTAAAELVRRLDGYVRLNSVGVARFAPADISLGEDEVLQPDLFVVPASLNPRTWQDVQSLLLVIEILSPGTARYDRLVKRRRYQRARVPEYWIVDLDARLVERWRPDDTRPEILTEILEWTPAPGLTPMVIQLPEFFVEVWGE
jgi:Uma2 family endonuclease